MISGFGLLVWYKRCHFWNPKPPVLEPSILRKYRLYINDKKEEGGYSRSIRPFGTGVPGPMEDLDPIIQLPHC